jgi:hypothetical protein
MAHPRAANASDRQSHLRVVEMGMVPDDPGGNWAIAFTRDGDGLVTAIRLTKDTITYQTTVGRDVNDRITTLSAFVVA